MNPYTYKRRLEPEKSIFKNVIEAPVHHVTAFSFIALVAVSVIVSIFYQTSHWTADQPAPVAIHSQPKQQVLGTTIIKNASTVATTSSMSQK